MLKYPQLSFKKDLTPLEMKFEVAHGTTQGINRLR